MRRVRCRNWSLRCQSNFPAKMPEIFFIPKFLRHCSLFIKLYRILNDPIFCGKHIFGERTYPCNRNSRTAKGVLAGEGRLLGRGRGPNRPGRGYVQIFSFTLHVIILETNKIFSLYITL